MFYEGAVWDGVEPLGGGASLEGNGFGAVGLECPLGLILLLPHFLRCNKSLCRLSQKSPSGCASLRLWDVSLSLPYIASVRYSVTLTRKVIEDG